MKTLPEIDQALTERMGRCYCDWSFDPEREIRIWICHDCSAYKVKKFKPKNPSPTTNWQDYGELLGWAKEQEWWMEFCIWLTVHPTLLDINAITNPETGSRAIEEFLTNREKEK